MADSLSFPGAIDVPAARAEASTAALPWYIWCGLIGVTSAMIGGHWDISWHRSIGRDTFLTPAHLAIYFCGVLAGISCGYLILSSTFGQSAYPRQATVRMWGFRGPLGAFMAAWGGVAMLTSAPFDDWWHAAYGLDVKIVSPPHVLLILGMIMIEVGVLILILGAMNRASGALKRKLDWSFLYMGGMLLVVLNILTMEYIFRPGMHNAYFYRVVAIAMPPVLAALVRSSEKRWAATITAGVFTGLLLMMMWVLPLFPAEPKLGPVMNPVTQFIPAEFPLLLLAPAFAFDLLRRSFEAWPRWISAVVGGAVFVAVFVAVQWPFADFLMSPSARNAFWGSIYFDYNTPPQSLYIRHQFFPPEATQLFWTRMFQAVLFAMASTWAGLAGGDWMRRVKR